MDKSFKDGLEVAIRSKLDSLSTNCQFAASLRLDINEFPNNCEDMPVPVSLEKLKKLTRAISNGSNYKPDETDRPKHLLKSKKLWPISGQELLTKHGFTALAEKYSETLPALTNKMLRLMDLEPLVFKVKLTLVSVIICGTGHSHDNGSGTSKWSFVEDKVRGPFMKMVLQIPVEGGHEGGRSKVELDDQIRLFNVCDGSDRDYHLTTFYSECDHTFEEVKFGYRLTMQFVLELETTPLLSSLSPSVDLHTFLAVNDVQKTLAHWAPYENNQPNMLVLLLEHCYAPSEINFSRLERKDRLLARLLLSVGTVDMYLAQLRKTVFGPNNKTLSEEESVETDEENSVETDEENSETERPIANCLCCIQKRCKCLRPETQTISDVVYPEIGVSVEIACLTCLDGRIVECRPLKVDIDTNVIPFNRGLYTFEYDFCPKMFGDSYSNFRHVLHPRSVLVISPKNSLDLMLSCNFTAALDQLEANPNIRALNRVITFCQDFPEKVWLEAVDREERTRRLVSICLQLDTNYHGLRLLRLLAYNFPGHPIHQYEGLRSKAIAIGVARLIKKVGVTTSNFMSDLVCEHRAGEQIENFAHLVMELYNVDLKDVAENIGSKCVTFLYSKSKNLMPSLSVSTLVTCAAMVFRMYEENPQVRGLVTLHILITFGDGLKLLPLPMLFSVIEGIQTTYQSQLDNIQECQRMQQDLHRKLLSYFIPKALAEEVMLFYLKLDDAILLKEIAQELVNQSNFDAIKMIVASADVWYQALTTMEGKWALNLLVSTRINHLEGMRLPVFSWIQGTAVFDDPPLKRFFHSSEARATFPGFTSLQAAKTWCKKYFGPDQLDNGFSAKTEIKGEMAKYQCVVTKTRKLHCYHVELFHESRSELLELKDRRLRLLPLEEYGFKVTNFITTSQQSDPVSSESTSCVSSLPPSKRIRRSDSNRNRK